MGFGMARFHGHLVNVAFGRRPDQRLAARLPAPHKPLDGSIVKDIFLMSDHIEVPEEGGKLAGRQCKCWITDVIVRPATLS